MLAQRAFKVKRYLSRILVAIKKTASEYVCITKK